jgi:2-polyprenyl-3-methyl-5-hydroxy-6-metoxy-1,4-benzoquinol methylase
MNDAPTDITPTSPSSMASPRVLIFVVLYESAQQIERTLTRIPRELLDSPEVDLLVIDDSSPDDSADRALAWARANGVAKLTVLRNPVNLGYGGNQKLGYRIAVDQGYGLVILLHGDGQYAPELLPQFIDTWRASNADVILGSRMMNVADARKGGMPAYKRIGNRFLTALQNKLTGQQISEYHTGYRAYSTAFLRSVPFEANTSDFHFDTEILLQAFHVGARVQQFAIPTHYGDEICHVDGKSYGINVLLATARYRLHQMGMLCSLKFRNLSPLRYRDKTQTLYSSHRIAIEQVKKLGGEVKRVLDVGCGPGFVARELERAGYHVTGVDAEQPLPEMMSEFHKLDLDAGGLPVDAFDYDAVLMLDVIEHLAEPEAFLVSLRNRSRASAAVRKPPALVLTTPNIAFAAMRLNLLLGRFNYAERGILDITHKRLFTKHALRRALVESGYQVQSLTGIGPPFETVMGGRKFGRFLGWMTNLLARVWPSMFAFQFLVVARPTPGTRQLLAQSQSYQRGRVVAETFVDGIAVRSGDEASSVGSST